MASIRLVMYSAHDWTCESKAHALWQLLAGGERFLPPERLDKKEPIRKLFKKGGKVLLDLWPAKGGYLFFDRQEPYSALLTLQIWPKEAKQLNEFQATLDVGYLNDESAIEYLLQFAEALYAWGNMAHGYIVHEEDWRRKNSFQVPTEIHGGRIVSTGGVWLDEGLPGLYWANFFGPAYVAFLGSETFARVDAYSAKRLTDGGYLVRISKSPCDYGKSGIESLTQSVISHLGCDAFFDKKYPLKTCRVPQKLFESNGPQDDFRLSSYDPVAQIIPDAPVFLKGVKTTAERLVRHVGPELDYTVGSLRRLDQTVLKNVEPEQKGQLNEETKVLLQQMTAYLGEVICRHFKGWWELGNRTAGVEHPVVRFIFEGLEHTEYPFREIWKLWLDPECEDTLYLRYGDKAHPESAESAD